MERAQQSQKPLKHENTQPGQDAIPAFLQALIHSNNTMNEFNLGTLRVTYTPTDNEGPLDIAVETAEAVDITRDLRSSAALWSEIEDQCDKHMRLERSLYLLEHRK